MGKANREPRAVLELAVWAMMEERRLSPFRGDSKRSERRVRIEDSNLCRVRDLARRTLSDRRRHEIKRQATRDGVTVGRCFVLSSVTVFQCETDQELTRRILGQLLAFPCGFSENAGSR